jgi:putative ABC transport system permease protein
MLSDYFRIAFRGIKRRKLRSWLTMLGIFIGIAAIVSLIGLGEGLRNAVMSQFNMLGSDIITVRAGGLHFYGPPGTGVVNPLESDYTSKLENVQGVDWAIDRLIKNVKTEFNGHVEFGVAGSIPSGEHRKEIYSVVGIKAHKGRLLKDGDRYKVVLGYNFVDKDVFGKPIKVGSRILVQDKSFEVIGIAERVGNFVIDNAYIINDEIMREVLDEQEEVSVIVVKAKKGANMNTVKERIEKVLRKERDVKKGEEDFMVEVSEDLLETLNSTLFAVQLFVYIIASISLVVGGIGIMNTMYTAVVERTKEIGIIKSVGARNGDIFWLFFIESGLLGMVGGGVGVLMGVGIAKGLAFIGSMQLGSELISAHISFYLVAGALLFSFVVGAIAGITPAFKASRLQPVEALRHVK